MHVCSAFSLNPVSCPSLLSSQHNYYGQQRRFTSRLQTTTKEDDPNWDNQVQDSAGDLNKSTEKLYQNRVQIMQHLLEEKVNDADLLSKKTKVLENVVQKMKEQQMNEQNKSSNIQEDLKKQRDQLQRDMEQFQSQLKQTQDKIQRQQTEHTRALQQLRRKHSEEQAILRERIQNYETKEKAYNERIQHLQQEVVQLDDELEKLQQKNIVEESKYERKISQLQSLLKQNKYKHEQELLLAHTERDTMVARNQEMEQQILELSSQNTTSTANITEQIMIAKASVSAAERRELDWKQKYEELEQKLEVLQNESQIERESFVQEQEQRNLERQKQVQERISKLQSRHPPKRASRWRRVISRFWIIDV